MRKSRKQLIKEYDESVLKVCRALRSHKYDLANELREESRKIFGQIEELYLNPRVCDCLSLMWDNIVLKFKTTFSAIVHVLGELYLRTKVLKFHKVLAHYLRLILNHLQPKQN